MSGIGAKPSQAKELNEGGDLRFVQFDIHLSVGHSLGSITDTLTLTGEYAYSNDLKSG